jgi:hypothetical protein
MLTFVAVYRGASLATAKLVVVTIDPAIVVDLAEKLLAQQEDTEEDLLNDEALQALTTSQRHALKVVRAEAARLAQAWGGEGEEDYADS